MAFYSLGLLFDVELDVPRLKAMREQRRTFTLKAWDKDVLSLSPHPGGLPLVRTKGEGGGHTTAAT